MQSERPRSPKFLLLAEMSHKLGPIYEALDSRNPKLAVKLCDSILKKSGVPIVAALKAVALDRMGKGEEAFSLATERRATLPPHKHVH